MKKFIWTVVLVLSPVFLNAAFACGCPTVGGQTSEEIQKSRLNVFERTAAIFIGEVIELEQNKVKFKVEKIWKGDSVDEITMSIQQGKHNGKSVSTSCDYRFEMGERYLVYAIYINDELNTGACSRTTSLKQVERAEEEIRGLNEIRLPEIRKTKSELPLMLKGGIW